MISNIKRLQWCSSLVGAVTIVTTLLTCLIITRVRRIYVGGLVWPYFSDMGREAPAYYVFIVGLSITGVALSIQWQINGKLQRNQLHETTPRAYQWALTLATFLASGSPVCMPILAIFDTSTHTWTHAVAAGLFFLFQTLAVLLNTAVTFHIYKAAKRAVEDLTPLASDKPSALHQHLRRVRRTFHLQGSVCTLFFVAFMLYVPVGMLLVEGYTRLTIQQCLDRHLGEYYCNHTVKLDDVNTKLWNYEIGFPVNQMRTLMQLTCILALIGYTGSFLTIAHEDQEDSIETPLSQRATITPTSADYEWLDKTPTSPNGYASWADRRTCENLPSAGAFIV